MRKDVTRLSGLSDFARTAIAFAMVLIIMCLTSGITVYASIPEPTNDFYVADYADVLSESTESQIISESEALDISSGAQIVVVTVDFTDGAAIEDYAYELYNDWGIGNSNNEGLLILLSIGEDNYWVTQGAGLESALSSARMQTILDNYMEPDFAVGDYDNAVLKSYGQFLPIVQSAASGNADYGNGTYGYEQNGYSDTHASDYVSGAAGIISTFIRLMVLIIIIAVLFRLFASHGRRPYVNAPGTYRRTRILPFFLINNRHHRHPPNPPHMDPGPGPGPGSGPRPGTGAGRSSNFSGFSGSNHSVNRSGSSHSGGGGRTRGGGAGRHR